MDLTLRTKVFGVDNQTWLGSREGTDTARSVTLTTSTFTADANGNIPSGTPVTPDASTGRYKLWVTGTPLSGFTLTPQHVVVDGVTSGNVVAPLIDRGRIVLANLPTTVDATGRGTAPRFIFV